MLTIRDVMDYEVKSSLWAGHVSHPWFQALAAWYYGRKVRRKYGRYRRVERMKVTAERFQKQVIGYRSWSEVLKYPPDEG